MTVKTVQVELPAELIAAAKTGAADVSQEAARLLALELFREGRASLERAAELCATPPAAFAAFAVEHGVPLSAPPSELVFGLVAAVGTPVTFFTNVLKEALKSRGYNAELIRLSSFTKAVRLDTPPPPEGADEYTRISTLMKHGNELREKAERGDVLALFAVARIKTKRPTVRPSDADGRALILRQLKHPEEIYRLRSVYDEGFHVIGLYCPKEARRTDLRVHGGMTEEQADDLIRRDENEPPKWGQKFRDSFHLSDVFIEMKQAAPDATDKQLERFLGLLFGEKIVTPSRDEYGMFLAHAAALRSSSLSRQVGAAILSARGELLSLGCNEVPCFRGGQYWGDEETDGRDVARKVDSSDVTKHEILKEILDHIDPEWKKLGQDEQMEEVLDLASKLENTRVMNLTEFGRAVHAEMEAITAAARVGVSIRGATLYTTTFPCHVCAKHIVGAGIERVVYVEPYPKSLAIDLHSDSVSVDGESGRDKVRFEPFVGVAPRRYAELFSSRTKEGMRHRRKDRLGNLLEQPTGLRLRMVPYSYLEREGTGADELSRIIGRDEDDETTS